MPLWLGGGVTEGTELDKKPLCRCPGCNPVPLTTDKIYHWAAYGKAAERGVACGKTCNSKTANRTLPLHWKAASEALLFWPQGENRLLYMCE